MGIAVTVGLFVVIMEDVVSCIVFPSDSLAKVTNNVGDDCVMVGRTVS